MKKRRISVERIVGVLKRAEVCACGRADPEGGDQ